MGSVGSFVFWSCTHNREMNVKYKLTIRFCSVAEVPLVGLPVCQLASYRSMVPFVAPL